MTIIEKLLLKEEDCVLHEYKDHLGYSTIGIGRLIDPRKGGGISQEEAEYLLRNDIAKKSAELDRELPWWRGLDEVRAAVLLSMCFQLGIGGLLKFRRTLAAIREGRWADAAAAMRGSLWYRQTPNRVERAAVAMTTGQPSDLGV